MPDFAAANDREWAVRTQGLYHRYGERVALAGIDLGAPRGEIFGLLGPNGGGKTTLFRILTTYFPVQAGHVWVLGIDVSENVAAVRSRIGVVFQHPSLDGKLTVAENLRCHASLYGLSRSECRSKSAQMLDRLGIASRAGDIVEKLSGGLQRRVELAKGMLHDPELLILDEPSTGLDPGARRDLWQYLRQLASEGVSILVTTHFMDEAERCDRVGIIDRGLLVAYGTPNELRSEVGGEVISLGSAAPDQLAKRLQETMGISARVMDEGVRLERAGGAEVVPALMKAGGDLVDSLAIAKPTLEDVFILRTGHRFWNNGHDA